MIPGGTNILSGPVSTNYAKAGTGFYRVVRDGVHLVGISNDMVLSGVVKIPVELANGSGEVTTMNITEDGSPIGDSIQSGPLSNPPKILFNTTLLPNGVHQIYGSATWNDTNGGIWEADSPTFSVTLSNEITFENWMPSFGELGDTLLFRATSAHTNTDWTVSVYNYTNAYLGYFSGHTYDGDISFYWDYSGTSATNSSSFSFEIATEYIDPPTPPTYKQIDPWTSSGGWVFGVQHAFDFITDHEFLYEELDGFLGGAASSYTIRPTPSSGTPFTIHFQDSSEISSWATFRSALYNNGSRNLVYFGHGGQSGIGFNSHDTNVFISATEIANTLHTIPAGQTNRHAFRFVFLDGCSTAKGNLPESFGMFHREDVDGIDYYYASIRRSAFCGWTSDKTVGFMSGSAVNYDHVSFITLIQTYMLLNYGLKQSVNMSANQPNIPLVTTGDFKVFGYWDLHIGTDNN